MNHDHSSILLLVEAVSANELSLATFSWLPVQVPPAELEAILISHPAIADAGVIP